MRRLSLLEALLILTTFVPYRSAIAQSIPPSPTVRLSYEKSTEVRNPIDVFMYFIPLTAPTRVNVEKSVDNTQTAWITDYDLHSKSGDFVLRCDFTIDGSGRYVNKFNAEDVIALNTMYLDHPQTTRNLEYMWFEGDGYGTIEITGEENDGDPVITNVSFRFDNRGVKSPVLVRLYSLDPVDGTYRYENRYNFILARLSSLSFEKPAQGEIPQMQVKLASVGNADSADGFFSSIKALFANLFMESTVVTSAGNKAVLDFAKAIFLKKDEYTFPEVENTEFPR